MSKDTQSRNFAWKAPSVAATACSFLPGSAAPLCPPSPGSRGTGTTKQPRAVSSWPWTWGVGLGAPSATETETPWGFPSAWSCTWYRGCATPLSDWKEQTVPWEHGSKGTGAERSGKARIPEQTTHTSRYEVRPQRPGYLLCGRASRPSVMIPHWGWACLCSMSSRNPEAPPGGQ